MKKILTLGLAFASLGFVHAQIKNDKGTFTKPGKGDIALETQTVIDVTGGSWFSLQGSLLGGLSGMYSAADFPLGIPAVAGGSVKARRFKSEKMAERASISLGFSNASTKNEGNVSGDKSGQSAFGLALSYGREMHMVGAERLSTYVGWQGSLGFMSVSNNATVGTLTGKVSQSTFGLGGGVFSGMDYYILPKVYLGAELGFGLNFMSKGKLNETPAPTPANTETKSMISLSPNMTGAMRFGYRF